MARTETGGAHDAASRRATFPAMGATATVIVVGGDAGHLAAAEAQLRRLDALWSRFRRDSDVSRLNGAGGAAVPVAPETIVLLDHLVAAWHATGGAFDPTVLPALVAAGDVASRCDPHNRTHLPATARWPGDVAALSTDARRGTARLPPGTTVDAGGLGKGLAADLVAADLLAAGAAGTLVSVGGDLRAAGRAPHGDWVVGVERPGAARECLARLTVADGGVATSAPSARRWHRDGVDHHHLIDPTTGRSSAVGVSSVTVVAASGAWAEAFTKVPYSLGAAAGITALGAVGAAALVVADDGHVLTTRAWDAFIDRSRT
jgi:FAD:protein FMN transferase